MQKVQLSLSFLLDRKYQFSLKLNILLRSVLKSRGPIHYVCNQYYQSNSPTKCSECDHIICKVYPLLVVFSSVHVPVHSNKHVSERSKRFQQF